jgi:DnaJ-class molecular chaperone
LPARGLAEPTAGDLYLVVEVLADERFERGDDLYTEVGAVTTAVLGEAPVLAIGRRVAMKVPA